MHKFTSEFDRPESYYEKIEMPTIGDYRDMLRFKDRSTAMFDRRWQEAKAVIDVIAEEVGVAGRGLVHYSLGLDDQCHIVDKIREILSRAGDKVQMKRRIEELEAENHVLRSLLQK